MAGASKILVDFLYHYKDYGLSVGTMICGWDKTGPQIYYVDKSSFKEGDALINTDTGEKYVIGETDTLEGVYCINKGYAVFRRIEILDENEEYAIVSKNTTYGLSRYDHIVRNADKVKEEDILY